MTYKSIAKEQDINPETKLYLVDKTVKIENTRVIKEGQDQWRNCCR